MIIDPWPPCGWLWGYVYMIIDPWPPCGWLWGYVYIIWSRTPFLNDQCSTMQLCILKWIPCLDSSLLIDSSHPNSPVQLLNSQRSPMRNGNLALSCLHKSLLNTARASWRCCDVTQQDKIHYSELNEWCHVTVVSAMGCSWRNSCILTDYTYDRLTYIVVTHFVIKNDNSDPDYWVHDFPSNMKVHLYFADSLHFRLERLFIADVLHNIFRNAPQSTPWIYDCVWT
jgi:hypothetical protein